MKLLRRLFGRRRPVGDPVRVAEAERVLAELRPSVAADGGDIRLLEVRGGTVRVSLHGACRSCAASTLTLRGALEPRLRERLRWFEALES